MTDQVISVDEIIRGNLELRHKYHRDFSRIFHVSLASFFSNLTGFDVVAFDERFIQSKEGESCEDAIRDIYGEEGVTLVWNLMGGKPKENSKAAL